MSERRGEKLGWVCGWIGGFIWLLPVSILWFFYDKVAAGIILLLIFILAVTLIFQLTPWRYPKTYYYKLMLPNLFLFYLSAAVCIYFFYQFENEKTDWYLFAWLIVCLTPILTVGKRKWDM